jgi:hypothetical protein
MFTVHKVGIGNNSYAHFVHKMDDWSDFHPNHSELDQVRRTALTFGISEKHAYKWITFLGREPGSKKNSTWGLRLNVYEPEHIFLPPLGYRWTAPHSRKLRKETAEDLVLDKASWASYQAMRKKPNLSHAGYRVVKRFMNLHYYR